VHNINYFLKEKKNNACFNNSVDSSSWKLAPYKFLCADMASEGAKTIFAPLQNEKQQV